LHGGAIRADEKFSYGNFQDPCALQLLPIFLPY